MGSDSRMKTILPGLAALATALGIFGAIGENAALASNIVNHNSDQQAKWQLLEATMRACLNHAIETEKIPSRRQLHDFAKAFADYWRALGVEERTVTIIYNAMVFYIDTNAGS